MARTDTQLKFRIPPDLKPRLERAARANKRSINMEVIARLEMSFKQEPKTDARSRAAMAKLLNMGTPATSASDDDLLEQRVAKLEHHVQTLIKMLKPGSDT